MQLSIITAFDKNRVIGFRNKLPWSLPADLLHFKRITWGKTIVMGRNTFESIGRPLPGRKNIILSRQKINIPECNVFPTLQDALNEMVEEKEIFIIGGANVYEQTISLVSRMYLTIVHHEFQGDTFFPLWDSEEWEVIEQEDFMSDNNNMYNYTFQTLKRIE